MLGYVANVQRKEIRQGITCVKHQNIAGSDIGDDHKEYFAGEAALFGGAPTSEEPNPIKPVVDVAVVQTRTVSALSGRGSVYYRGTRLPIVAGALKNISRTSMRSAI